METYEKKIISRLNKLNLKRFVRLRFEKIGSIMLLSLSSWRACW